MKISAKTILLTPLMVLILSASLGFAWEDYTHMAIARAAGIDRDYAAVGPDIIRVKFHNEYNNHFYDAGRNEKITHCLVARQVFQYDRCDDQKGCLLGSVVGGYRAYKIAVSNNKKNAHYLLGIMAHYIGDLSSPLHLSDYDDFNKAHHEANDKLIDNEVALNIKGITVQMKEVTVKNEDDLIKEVILIAEQSRKLSYLLRDQNRDMTREEAYQQAAMSSSLIKAIK